MTYRELQAKLKQYRDQGLTDIRLNASREELEAELRRLTVVNEMINGLWAQHGIIGEDAINTAIAEMEEAIAPVENSEMMEAVIAPGEVSEVEKIAIAQSVNLLEQEPPRQIDSNGQLSIFWDNSDEPPDPDDFRWLDEYEEAWAEWCNNYPELAEAIANRKKMMQSEEIAIAPGEISIDPVTKLPISEEVECVYCSGLGEIINYFGNRCDCFCCDGKGKIHPKVITMIKEYETFEEFNKAYCKWVEELQERQKIENEIDQARSPPT